MSTEEDQKRMFKGALLSVEDLPHARYDFRRTDPWLDEEYLIVDGIRCVYSHDATGLMVVHMLGGVKWSLNELRAHGCVVVMPRKVRMQKLIVS
jgi:hypothetical protein